jgi:hypothetical protein
MTSSCDDPDGSLPGEGTRPADHTPRRSRARLARLVAAAALGVAALAGAAASSTSSLLTDQRSVTIEVTAAPDFSSTATPTPTPTQTPTPTPTPTR